MLQLMVDIEQGAIDAVVVYKVDRLTRSLADFAKMLEIFDGRRVSFVRGDPAVQHHDFDGALDPECFALVCPVRTGGNR